MTTLMGLPMPNDHLFSRFRHGTRAQSHAHAVRMSTFRLGLHALAGGGVRPACTGHVAATVPSLSCSSMPMVIRTRPN